MLFTTLCSILLIGRVCLFNNTTKMSRLRHILTWHLMSHFVHLHDLTRRKEGNVLFNDAPNTFYLRLYVVRHGKGLEPVDFPRSRNRARKRGKAYLKRNSRFSPKTLLVTFKKYTLLSKRTFQRHFENRNSRYLTTLIFVSVTPN